MADFNWVEAFASCSLSTVFHRLRLEIEADVEARNKLRGERPFYSFAIGSNQGNVFSVVLSGNGLTSRWVDFRLTEKSIRVSDESGNCTLEVTLTLNDDGQCRLKTKDRQYEFWQFRRLALEHLFFEIV